MAFDIKLRACLRVHGHHAVGQPQGQAIDYQQHIGTTVHGQSLRQGQGLFNGSHARHTLRAVGLMAADARAHFLVPGLGCGDQYGAMVC